MSRQWAENALLNFDKLGDDPFKESNLTKNTAGITVPINLNPVLNNGKYEKVISDLGSELETLAKSVQETLENSLNNSIYNVISSVGESLVSGENFFKSLGASLLSGLGEILINLGKMAFGVGIGIESIKKALVTLQGPIAIAAGVAAIALGSAFKSGASKLGNSMGSGGTSSSSYTSSATSNQNMVPRGAYYNNDRQVVDVKIKGNNLVGSLNINQNRNTRIK